MNDLKQLDFFLGLLSLRLFGTFLEDESALNGGGEIGASTTSFPDLFTSCTTILAAHRAVGATVAVPLATAEATMASYFRSIAT